MKRPPLQVPIAVVVGSIAHLSTRARPPCARAAPPPGARARARRRPRRAHRRLPGIAACACACDPRAQLLELGDAEREVLAALGAQLGQRQREGAVQLERGVRRGGPGRGPGARAARAPRTAAVVPRAPSSAARRSCGTQRRRSDRGPDRAAQPAAPAGVRRPGQLARVQPAPVGDLLALAPAGPDHERLGGGDLVDVGIGRGDAVRVERRG